MNVRIPTAVVLAVLAFGSVPATAQSFRSAAGLTLGGSLHGDLTPGLDVSTRFQSGWIVGLQYEYWLGSGRTGLRVNTLFTQRLLDSEQYGDYNVFIGDMDFMFRILPPRADRTVIPFLSAGLGATHWGAVAGTGPLAGGVYGDNVVRPHLLVSVGADMATPGPVGVRVEIGDEIVLPSIGYSPSFTGLPNVHNLLATVAVQLRMGSLSGAGERAPTRLAPEPPAAAAPADPATEEVKQAVSRLESRISELTREVSRLQRRIDELQTAVDGGTGPVETGPEEGAEVRARFTVQVGSFHEPRRADRLLSELRASGLTVWRWDAITRNQTFSRVRVGALSTEAEAERLAEILHREHGLPVWVDRIDPAETVPPDAVTDTRDFLSAFRD